MIDLDEFLTHLEVQTNILNEQKREQELYQRGVDAMRRAQGLDASDYADSPQNRVQEIVITGVQS